MTRIFGHAVINNINLICDSFLLCWYSVHMSELGGANAAENHPLLRLLALCQVKHSDWWIVYIYWALKSFLLVDIKHQDSRTLITCV